MKFNVKPSSWACPVLVTAAVRKGSVLTLKLDREEQEVIMFRAGRISMASLVVPPVVIV